MSFVGLRNIIITDIPHKNKHIFRGEWEENKT